MITNPCNFSNRNLSSLEVPEPELAQIFQTARCNNAMKTALFNYCISGSVRGNPVCKKYVDRFYNEGMLPEEKLRKLFDLASSSDQNHIKSEVFSWLLKQDNYNNANATYYLALCYLRGIGTDKNSDKASKCFEKAIRQKHAPSQELLDDLSLRFPTERSHQMHLYLEAAKRNHLKGMVLYSWLQLIQSNWNSDTTDAVDWLQSAVQLEVPQTAPEADHAIVYKGIAYYLLGNCYRDGIGLPIDQDLAVHCYQHAAELHFGAAFFELGNCYSLGYGVPSDLSRAAQLYQRAADLDFPIAFLKLGNCYQYGKGVLKNVEHANHLLLQAARLERNIHNLFSEYERCYKFRFHYEIR